MDSKTEFYMQKTLLLAQEALTQGEFPIAALVVLDDQVIASAATAEKSEGRLLVHAELAALMQADKLRPFPGRRRDARLFTNLEPCLMCLGAAMSFHLGEIFFGLESPSDGAVGLVEGWKREEESLPGYRFPLITGGVLRQESIHLFQEYVARNSPGPMRDWARSLASLRQEY